MNSYTYFANLKKVMETESLAPQELALLQALIMVANNCGWQEELTPRNAILMTYSGLSNRISLAKWRNSLVEKGLIEFTERKRNAGVYKLGKKLTASSAKTKKVETKPVKSKPKKKHEPVEVQQRKARRVQEWRNFMSLYLPVDRLSVMERNDLEARYIDFVDDHFADSTRASLAAVDWEEIESPGKYIRAVIRNKQAVEQMKLKNLEEKLKL